MIGGCLAAFQHGSELAIRATVFLAQQAPGKLSPIHEIAVHAGASEAYLSKILQRLASAGLVRSFRGPGKGTELGRAPGAITLASLIRAIEGSKTGDECILGLGVCSEETPCVLHKKWVPIRIAIRELVEETTLADLAETLRSRRSKKLCGQPIGGSRTPVVEVSRGRRHP